MVLPTLSTDRPAMIASMAAPATTCSSVVEAKTASGGKQDATPSVFKAAPATPSSKTFPTVQTASSSAQAAADSSSKPAVMTFSSINAEISWPSSKTLLVIYSAGADTSADPNALNILASSLSRWRQAAIADVMASNVGMIPNVSNRFRDAAVIPPCPEILPTAAADKRPCAA